MKRRSMLTIVSAVLMVFLFVSIYGLTGYGRSDPIELNETLPVELSSFTANVTTVGSVQLQWVAETETNMLGYNVYRSEENKLAGAVAVNRAVIPAHNTSTTSTYTFTDVDVLSGSTYYYWLQSMDLDLTNVFHGPLSITIDDEKTEEQPQVFATSLQRNYPNPFNPVTTIEYSIREETEISLRIYNLHGQVVRTLADGMQKEGYYSVNWDGTDNSGKDVGSGIYFYRLTTNHYDKVHKMLLVK